MSIINDALKKSQENIDKKSENQDVTDLYDKLHPSSGGVTPPRQAQTTSSSGSNPFQTLFAFIFLLASLAGLFFAFLHFVDNDTTRTLKRQLITLQRIKITPPALPKPITTKTPATTPIAQTVAVATPAPIAATPVQPKVPDSTLVLNGTMQNDKSTAALINNEVYEVGDVVEGKKITSITLNKVELTDNQGVVTVLRVK